MTKKYKNKTKFLSKTLIAFMCLLSISSAFGILFGAKMVFAYTEPVTTWSNLNFASNNNLSNVYTSPSGWTLGFTDTKATSGAINVDHFND